MIKREAVKNCSIVVSLKVISEKWKPIIFYCLSQGEKRFIDIWRNIPNVNKKVLMDHLATLEKDGLIQRDTNAGFPPKTIYSLTGKGWSMIPLFENNQDWGSTHLNDAFKLG